MKVLGSPNLFEKLSFVERNLNQIIKLLMNPFNINSRCGNLTNLTEMDLYRTFIIAEG